MKRWPSYVLLVVVLMLCGFDVWYLLRIGTNARFRAATYVLWQIKTGGGSPQAPNKIGGGSMNLHSKAKPNLYSSWYCTNCSQVNAATDRLEIFGADAGLRGLGWIPFLAFAGDQEPWILELDARDTSGNPDNSSSGLVVCTNPNSSKPTNPTSISTTLCASTGTRSNGIYYIPFPQNGTKTGFYPNERPHGDDGSSYLQRYRDFTCNDSAYQGDHDYCEHIGQMTLTIGNTKYSGKCVDGECTIIIR